jgi:hypothetical protein
MSRNRNDSGSGRLRIQAHVLDVRADEKPPALFAYTFARSGRLLARTELKEGKGELQVPELKEPENVRVLIGPPIESEESQTVLSTLMRLNAPDIAVRSDQISEAIRFPIDRDLWLCWFRFCVVRGTLLKRTTTGGLHVDLPVCGAEVEIYEVDPILVIFPKIPDLQLERIRDLIRKPWPPPPPPEERMLGGIPFPPEPPGPGPFLGGEPTLRRAPMARKATTAGTLRNEVLSIMAELRGEDELSADLKTEAAAGKEAVRLFDFPSSEPAEVDAEEAMESVRALSEVPAIKSAANVSLATFKSALLSHPELIRPILCWIWPPAVNMQLVATATTDECGKFRAKFLRGCSSDTPDLYFKAYRNLGYFRIQIYGPLPVACYTWWNYVCGSEVTLITTNPFALTCPPCKPVIAPPHWVLAMAVGNTSLANVRGTSTALQPTTDASNIGLTGGGAPFGGYIRLRFEFDNTLRTDLNVRYYQVRWRKLGTLNGYLPLTEDVWRHYAHMVGTTLMIEPYKLGPQVVGSTANLYEIPPALPPTGQWSIPDAVVDTTSAAFPSVALAPAGGEGDYRFELSLYDGGGNLVNANTLGINYVVPTTLDLTATIPTANASLLGLVTASGRLIYQLHVDNNPCNAAVAPPDIGGSISADPCGLLRYGPGDSVTLHWTAAHPHQFATFKHAVVRGATELGAPMTTLGTVTPAPGTHSDTHAVSDLLGTCTIAGFAEAVSVWAMATDGWSRQDQYDRHVIQAFALAPEET